MTSEQQKAKSYDSDSLDFSKLEKELHKAVEDDKRYWRENDAKFRAVHQKVESYEEFRDIVLASHIKPLEKGDRLQDTTFDVKWNAHAERNKGGSEIRTGELKQVQQKDLPKDSQEFVRDWRRHHKTAESQYQFLLSIGGQQLAKIFKTEISLFGDILMALDLGFKVDDHSEIVAILHNLCTANRFSLSVQFLSGKEKNCRDGLFKKLQEVESDEETKETIRKLESVYEIKK